MTFVFIAILGVYQFLLFFVHAAIYKTLGAAFGWDFPWLAWLFGVLSVLFVISSVLSHYWYNWFTTRLYRFGAYWFGLIHFIFVGALAFSLISSLVYSRDYYISSALLGGLTLGSMFLVHTYATWRTQMPRYTETSISIPHLPVFWKNKKIVFISDVHLGAVWGRRFSRKIVDRMKALKPDLVLIGGDLFDGVICPADFFLSPFASIPVSEGIYYITGNHEYINGSIQVFLKAIRDVGMHILDNQSVDLHGLTIAGVDWKTTYEKHAFEHALSKMNIDRAKPSILLRHEPSHLDVSRDAGISLTLSGHTHAGQIFPLRYLTRNIYNGFDYGLKYLEKMAVYTSSGIGTWGPPLRLGTKSEMVVITLT